MFYNAYFNRKGNKFQLKGKTLHLEALEDRTLLSASPLHMDSLDSAPAMVAPSQASENLTPDSSVVSDLGEIEQQTPETLPVALNASYNANDVMKLRTFLEQTDENGVKNGVKLNSAYKSQDVSTWTGVTWTDVNGSMRVTEINWVNKDLAGSLNVSSFTSLIWLLLDDSQLTSLNASGCTALRYLTCSNNQLTLLDVSNNASLSNLYIDNNRLTSLDLSNNTALKMLLCNDNQLTFLDLSKNTALEFLNCENNQLTSLKVSKNTLLYSLFCENNQLTSLDLSKNTLLERVDCENNQLRSLDLSKNTLLTRLDCYNNLLTSLNVSNCTLLEELWCYNNLLAEIDLSNNTALNILNCGSNPLVTLDLSNNTALTKLECSYLPLTMLDVSNNTALKELLCWNPDLNTVILPSVRSADIALCLSYGSKTEWTFTDVNENDLKDCDLSYDRVIYSCGSLVPTTSLPVYATNDDNGQTVVFTEAKSPEVNARIVFQNSLTNVDISSTLPTGVSSVRTGQTFYVEIWLKDVDDADPAFSGAYMNMLYDFASLTALNVVYGTVFDSQTDCYTLENAKIATIGGAAAFGVLDKGDDEWVRLATVSFVAEAEGTTTISLDAPNDPHDNVTRTDGATLSPWEINFGSATLTISHVCPMDIDGDGYIGLSDYSLMSKAWRTSPEKANWNPACDIDGDSYVGLSDYTFLSKNWRKYTTDPNLSYPGDNAGAVSVPSLTDDSAVEQTAPDAAPVQQVDSAQPSPAAALGANSEESTSTNALILVSGSKTESTMTLREARSAALLDLYDNQVSSDLQSVSDVLAETRLESPAEVSADSDSQQTTNGAIDAVLEEDVLAINWE